MRVQWAARSDPGVRRPTNEDSFVTRPDLGLFVVADGMGGHVAGEVASRIVVQAIEAFVAETIHADAQSTWPLGFDPSLSLDGNRLKGAFHMANERLAEEVAESQDLRGMATTASAVLMNGKGAEVVLAHVGDSRIYLWRDAEIARQTIDHSWVEEQVRAGLLSANEARQHPWRNVVTRALSGGDEPQVDLQAIQVKTNDRVLLCSDGLSSVVTDARIAAILTAHPDPSSACEALVAEANGAGGPDNVTTLVIHIDAA